MPSPSFRALIEQHYATLRQLAGRALRDRASVERMSPTSLVAECVVRLLRQHEEPVSEDHLRGLATVFMTRVLADSARKRMRQRNGADRQPRSLDETTVRLELSTDERMPDGRAVAHAEIDRSELLQAMEALAHERPRQMEVVTLHVVAGIPMVRVAELVGVSERTAYRELEDGREALARKLKN